MSVSPHTTVPAKDPATILSQNVLGRKERSAPFIVGASIVRASFVVGPQPGSGGDPAKTTTGTPGDSRFRCPHMLTGKPNIVYVMRDGQEVGNLPGGGILYRNTVESAAVLINTSDPIADDTYSYFTITLPMVGWHEYNVTGSAGTPAIMRYFDADLSSGAISKWGSVRGISAMEYNTAGFDPDALQWSLLDPGAGRDDNHELQIFAPDSPSFNVNLSVFFQKAMGSLVTVRVVSIILGNLSFDGFAPPGSASAAP